MVNTVAETKETHLTDICGECLMLIVQLRITHQFGEPDILRERILKLLDEIEREARMHGYTMDDIQNVKFALVAFLDESIIASDWSHRELWISNPLQLQLYNRFDAGEEFYNRLNKMLDEIQLNTDVLEVYYLCLTLGFKGKFGSVAQENQRVIIDDIYQELKLSYYNKPTGLSPDGGRKEAVSEVIKSSVPVWSIGLGAAIIGLVIYFIFSIFSVNIANWAVTQLQMIL